MTRDECLNLDSHDSNVIFFRDHPESVARFLDRENREFWSKFRALDHKRNLKAMMNRILGDFLEFLRGNWDGEEEKEKGLQRIQENKQTVKMQGNFFIRGKYPKWSRQSVVQGIFLLFVF